MVNESLISSLLKEVKSTKKYKNISDEIVLDQINSYLKSNPKITKVNKLTIKEIRSRLHRLYSSYQTNNKKKLDIYLDELNDSINSKESIDKNTMKLLTLVVSTKERIDDYEKLYQEIFSFTGIPDSILDLGSGLNPLSYPLMKLKKLKYFSYDINSEDISLLNKYFKIMIPFGLEGKADLIDVKNLESIRSLQDTDLVFIWKIIDLINTKNDKPGEELIKILSKKSKFIIASFSTRTISGKPMNLPRRKGFEIMLERIGLSFKVIKLRNEIFYIIKC